jgi:threonine 3-dehydrogenase
MVIGHEYVGTIVETGAGVSDLTEGERVTGEGHIACGLCRNCRRGKKHVCENTVGVGVHRDGAFAEYVAIPATNVIKVNPAIGDEVISVFDPFGNAVHTALSFPVVGEDVLITGAGPIGLMAAAVCRFAGARYIVVTDLNDHRLGLAEKLKVTKAVNPRREDISRVVQNLGMVGFDVGLEMSGSPQAFNDMIRNMYNGSKIALLGILPATTQIPWDELIFKALQIKGIYGREMFETWYKMEQMVLSGLDITPVITHRLPIDDFLDGFGIMEEGNCGKVILDWES